MSIGLVRIALVAFAAPLTAQQPVFIVDAQGGAGSHFTDLPEAIAAVPDGACLRVRPGDYSAFTLTKGLSIIGEDRNGVRIGSAGPPAPTVIGPTAPDQEVLVRNLILNPVWVPYGAVRIQAAAGTVAFDGVTFGLHTLIPILFTGSEMTVDRSANVQLHRCDLLSTLTTTLSATDSVLQISHSIVRGKSETSCNAGKDALHLVRSRCVAHASIIRGGDSSHAVVSLGGLCFSSGPGGTGIVVDDASTLVALDTAIGGGNGGSTRQFGSYYAYEHSGGDGLVVSGGSTASVYGPPPTGGLAGGPSAAPGAPFSTSSGGTVLLDPAAITTAGEILGDQARGQMLQFAVTAAPGSIGVLSIALQGSLVPLEPLLPGSLLFPTVLTSGLFNAPSGSTSLAYVVPAFWPLGETYFCQFLTADPGGRLWASNAISLNVSR